MALAALIAACAQVQNAGSDGLLATLPLVGGTLIEHQARQAARAGAGHIVVLVERLPSTLVAAIDRLRRDGLQVEIARSVADAADRVHPDEALLLIADGCILPQPALDRLVTQEGLALLTLPDRVEWQAFERIDAGSRWAGAALLDAAELRATAAMLGDWDVQSTLLRRCVQRGGMRIDLEGEMGLRPILATDARSLATAEQDLLVAVRSRADHWPGRLIFPLAERHAARLLIDRPLDPMWLAVAATVAALVAAMLALAGWRWPPLLLLMLSGPAAAVAARLAAARLSRVRGGERAETVRGLAAAGALLGLAAGLAGTQGWGWWLVGALAIGALPLVALIRRTATRLDPAPLPAWPASVDGMIWALLPFAFPGQWAAGLAALGLYAALSLGLELWRLCRLVTDRTADLADLGTP